MQLLTFKLDGEVYAIEVERIREVLDFREPARVPCVPDFVRGVINHRGEPVMVVDLKTRFGNSRTERNLHTCIIISEAWLQGSRIPLGALADSLTELVELDGKISFQTGNRSDANGSLASGTPLTHGGQPMKIVDLDGIFTPDEILSVTGAGFPVFTMPG